jgi:hypothetical protein
MGQVLSYAAPVPDAKVWFLHETTSQKPYYVNALTFESLYYKPEGFDNRDTLPSLSALEVIPTEFHKFASINVELKIHTETFLRDKTFPDLTATTPTGHDIWFYTKYILHEFYIYPASLFKRIGLKKIVLVANLRYLSNNAKMGGTMNATDGILYLDCKMNSVSHQSHTVHHELFHMMDSAMLPDMRNDKAWESFSNGIQYGSGGINNLESASHMHSSVDIPGFLNLYSLTAVEEDKAEIYASLIMHTRGMLEHRDEIIRAKSREIIKRVNELCLDLDDKFWEVQKTRVNLNNTLKWKEVTIDNGAKVWRNNLGGHAFTDPNLY